MSKSTLLLWCSVAVLLAAGGGAIDNELPPSATTHAVPARASRTSASLATLRTELSTASAEHQDPVDMSKFSPQQPEDQEPVDVSRFTPQQPEDTEPETVM